ncbi:MAG: hypothetical protein AABW67_01180 [Nanoarchaeota archaeon]
MKKEKKGSMTMTMLITIIILVIGFAIVFYFFVMFDWTGSIDKEVCHQSVIYRATLPAIAGIKEYVPLKCKTNKICITSGFIGGGCKEFENLKGVTKAKVSNTEQIEQIISREIVDCWKTMGEGKVQIFSQFMAEAYGVGNVGSSCVICNRIAFDNEGLTKAGINLSKIDVMKYMQTHAIPNQDISYYGYLAGEGGKISVKDNVNFVDISNPEKKGTEVIFDKTINLASEKFSVQEVDNTQELSIMFMQITAPTSSGVIRNDLKTIGIGAGLSFLASPKIATNLVGGVAKGGWITFALATVFGIYQQGSVVYNRAVTAGYCGDVSVGSDARDGCSVVRSVDYNVEDISQYCSIIESIP